ncbi:hypothetical protein LINGRAHAP2_LOCUS10140 [Linum grandiflorum]
MYLLRRVNFSLNPAIWKELSFKAIGRSRPSRNLMLRSEKSNFQKQNVTKNTNITKLLRNTTTKATMERLGICPKLASSSSSASALPAAACLPFLFTHAPASAMDLRSC